MAASVTDIQTEINERAEHKLRNINLLEDQSNNKQQLFESIPSTSPTLRSTSEEAVYFSYCSATISHCGFRAR